MSVYYQDDLVTLHLGDCREIDEWLAADVLVTDPPYGMAYVSNRAAAGPSKAIAGDASPELRDAALALWGTQKPAIVFGTWRVDKPAGIRQTGYWDKGDDPGTGDLSMPWGNSAEEFYVLGRGWVGKRGTNVLRCRGYSHVDRPNHPTPKPTALMERLLVNCPPGVIADPFAGSGATLIAARNQGRRVVGVELEEPYCELIATRLDQGALDFGASA
jgi:DNA modification methylase